MEDFSNDNFRVSLSLSFHLSFFGWLWSKGHSPELLEYLHETSKYTGEYQMKTLLTDMIERKEVTTMVVVNRVNFILAGKRRERNSTNIATCCWDVFTRLKVRVDTQHVFFLLENVWERCSMPKRSRSNKLFLTNFHNFSWFLMPPPSHGSSLSRSGTWGRRGSAPRKKFGVILNENFFPFFFTLQISFFMLYHLSSIHRACWRKFSELLPRLLVAELWTSKY